MKKLLPIIVLLFCSHVVMAQQPQNDDAPFKHLGVGLRASTLGGGIEVSTNLTKNFKLRGGFDYFGLKDNFDIDIDDDNFYEVLGYSPVLKTDGKLKLAHGHLLVDIHPMSYGIFHFTVGAYIGNSKITALGSLYNPDTDQVAQLPQGEMWPTINLDKYGIVVGDKASVDAALHLGNVVKPYLGIGIGRSLPNKRIGFMFELGAMYQGDLYIKQNGKKLVEMKDLEDSFADVRDYTKYIKWYPMLNFQLTYRIF